MAARSVCGKAGRWCKQIRLRLRLVRSCVIALRTVAGGVLREVGAGNARSMDEVRSEESLERHDVARWEGCAFKLHGKLA